MPVSPRQIGGAAGKHDLIALNRIAAILDLTAIKGAFKSTGSDFGDDEFGLARLGIRVAIERDVPSSDEGRWHGGHVHFFVCLIDINTDAAAQSTCQRQRRCRTQFEVHTDFPR